LGGGFGRATPTAFGLIALSALLGVVIPFTADTLAARASSARVIGTLFSLDPVMGLLAGLVILGQAVPVPALAGVGLVVSAGAALVWTSGRRAGASGGEREPDQYHE
jgi:inner membrane transporter RhtA